MTKPSFKECFVISEAEPLIKVGGLGDVGGTLPAALTALPREMTDGRAVDVRVVIPFHDVLKQKQIPVKWVCNYRIPYENGLFQDVYVSQAEGMDVPIYLIDGDPIRNKGVYSSNPVDDGYKYIFFSAAADENETTACLRPEISQRKDIIHNPQSALCRGKQSCHSGEIRY